MSSADPHATQPEHKDPIESIIHTIPVVLPVMGGVLMFLLAFIAVYMA